MTSPGSPGYRPLGATLALAPHFTLSTVSFYRSCRERNDISVTLAALG